MRHLIDPLDFTQQEISTLLDLADRIHDDPAAYQEVARHKKLATLFYEPSTRTRLSFEAAMLNLGGHVLGFPSALHIFHAALHTEICDYLRILSTILHENGAFVTQTALGFDGEATRKMRAFLQGPKPELLHHQKFFENGTAERAKESGTEQNYNMIDGCVNNVPKKPRRIGGRWSVLDRLHIKQAERRQKDNAPQQEQERSRKS